MALSCGGSLVGSGGHLPTYPNPVPLCVLPQKKFQIAVIEANYSHVPPHLLVTDQEPLVGNSVEPLAFSDSKSGKKTNKFHAHFVSIVQVKRLYRTDVLIILHIFYNKIMRTLIELNAIMYGFVYLQRFVKPSICTVLSAAASMSHLTSETSIILIACITIEVLDQCRGCCIVKTQHEQATFYSFETVFICCICKQVSNSPM
jgi:hypothetical protein